MKLNKNYKKIMLVVFLFTTLIIVTNSVNKNKGFSSAEVDFIFKTVSDRDSIVIKGETYGFSKGFSLDITSNKQILYFNNETWPKVNLGKTQEKIFITQDNHKIKAYLKNTDIVLSGETQYINLLHLNQFPTYLTLTRNRNNQINDHYHSIGFAHDIVESNSIIHYLYKERKISVRQFGIQFYENGIGLLTLGYEGEFLDAQNYLMKKCKAVKSKYWGCSLKGIYLGEPEYNDKKETVINEEKNKIIKLEQNTIFDNGVPYIITPCEVIEYLRNNYFDTFIKEGKCQIKDEDNTIKFVCPDEETKAQCPKVHFIFDDVIDINIKGYELFDKNSTFQIVCQKDNSHFVLGKSFLFRFNILFNYDEDKIIFSQFHGVDKLEKSPQYKEEIKVRALNDENYKRKIYTNIVIDDEDDEEERQKLTKLFFIILWGCALFAVICVFVDKYVNSNKKVNYININKAPGMQEEVEMK